MQFKFLAPTNVLLQLKKESDRMQWMESPSRPWNMHIWV